MCGLLLLYTHTPEALTQTVCHHRPPLLFFLILWFFVSIFRIISPHINDLLMYILKKTICTKNKEKEDNIGFGIFTIVHVGLCGVYEL